MASFQLNASKTHPLCSPVLQGWDIFLVLHFYVYMVRIIYYIILGYMSYISMLYVMYAYICLCYRLLVCYVLSINILYISLLCVSMLYTLHISAIYYIIVYYVISTLYVLCISIYAIFLECDPDSPASSYWWCVFCLPYPRISFPSFLPH